MAEAFVGEIRMFATTYAPKNWADCDGQLIEQAQNPVLYSVISDRFGSDGTKFALPDLKGRFPMHAYGSYAVGDNGGSEQVSLSAEHMPGHNDSIKCLEIEGSQYPTANFINTSSAQSSPHDNMPPFVALRFCICVAGVYPAQ